MKSALVAIDPLIKESKKFEHFCEILKAFQSEGYFIRTNIASIVHPGIYPIPSSYFRKMKGQYMSETYRNVKSLCQGRFKFDALTVHPSHTSYLEFLVEQLTKAAKKRHSEVLVVCSNDRSGLPYWILGSFSETATLTASYPLLVIKPTSGKGLFSKEVRFVLSIDVAEIPSSNCLRWIAMTAKISNAHLDLVYVRPKRRKIVGSLQSPKDSVDAEKILSNIQSFFEIEGIRTQSNILKESESVAHSLAQFSDSRKAWLTISTHVKRSRVRKLILGSTARRFLKLTKRPFLHLRLNS